MSVCVKYTADNLDKLNRLIQNFFNFFKTFFTFYILLNNFKLIPPIAMACIYH